MGCTYCFRQPDGCIACERAAQEGARNQSMIRLIELFHADNITLAYFVRMLKVSALMGAQCRR
jgi:hypothetical protein